MTDKLNANSVGMFASSTFKRKSKNAECHEKFGIPHIVLFLVSLSSVKLEGQKHMENKMWCSELCSGVLSARKCF